MCMTEFVNLINSSIELLNFVVSVVLKCRHVAELYVVRGGGSVYISGDPDP